jgi:thioredoxin-related protein
LLAEDALRTMLYPSWSADQKWTVEVKGIDARGRGLDLLIKPAKENENEYFLRILKARQSPEEQQLRLDPRRRKANANSKIDWLVGKDVAYAREIAGSPKVNKPVLLAFESRQCRWCAMMNKYTFRDREVVRLADRFVCAKIAFSPGADDTTKYNVQGTPTYVIVGRNGGEIARHSGFLRPTEFEAWLRSALR